MIDIYTDGSCSGNPGPGGWAAIVVTDGNQVELKGKENHTTSNRMELTAAIKGMSSVPEKTVINLYSDSQYLVKTMTQHWKRRANLDLWALIDSLAAHREAHWFWIEGHAGHPLNERADKLAVEMSTSVNSTSSEVRVPTHWDVKIPTHFDLAGNVSMVDVSDKAATERQAVAKGLVKMEPATLELIEQGQASKGDVLAVAQTAGTMAAKKTSELIPLCHPLRITKIAVDFVMNKEKSSIEITATVKADEKTGVEMEALTAVAVSALTIFDMCKAVDRGMKIDAIRMVQKSGGRSGTITLE